MRPKTAVLLHFSPSVTSGMTTSTVGCNFKLCQEPNHFLPSPLPRPWPGPELILQQPSTTFSPLLAFQQSVLHTAGTVIPGSRGHLMSCRHQVRAVPDLSQSPSGSLLLCPHICPWLYLREPPGPHLLSGTCSSLSFRSLFKGHSPCEAVLEGPI